MALTTFTAGQVLTAAQVNAVQANDYNQTVSTKVASYVLVTADKGTRVVMDAAGATTITVNTSLFNAGDTLFIQNIGAGTCTITAGTATVSTLGSLALDQYGSGTLYFTSAGVSIFYPSAGAAAAGGLMLIVPSSIVKGASGTASVSAGGRITLSGTESLAVNDVFSATYDNYKIIFTGVGSATALMNMRMRVDGADNSASNYVSSMLLWRQDNSGVSGTAGGTTNTSFTQAGQLTTSRRCDINLDVYEPFASFETTYTGMNLFTDTDYSGRVVMGATSVTTSYTGFTFYPVSGTFTGFISIYGYGKG